MRKKKPKRIPKVKKEGYLTAAEYSKVTIPYEGVLFTWVEEKLFIDSVGYFPDEFAEGSDAYMEWTYNPRTKASREWNELKVRNKEFPEKAPKKRSPKI